MSKRKRTSSDAIGDHFGGEEKHEPGKDMSYEEDLKEIENCKDSAHSPDWMRLDCLPYVPMMHILQYLNMEDMRNLRLTSRGMKNFLDPLMIIRIEYKSYDRDSFDPNLLNSDCDIDFNYRHLEGNVEDESAREAASALDQVSERVVKISGNAEFFMNLDIDNQGIVYSNVKEVTMSGLHEFPRRLMFPNLKILQLREIKLENFENGEYLLNNLDELEINDRNGKKGMLAILKTSRNIKYLTMNHVSEENELNADFKLPNLRTVELHDCSPEYLYIVTGSALTLTEISLRNIDCSIIATPAIQIPNLSRLYLCNNKFDENLITMHASSLEELQLEGEKFLRDLETSIIAFPNLKGLILSFISDEQATMIVKRSPKLKSVLLKVSCRYKSYSLTPSIDEPPGAICIHKDGNSEVDNEKFLEALKESASTNSESLVLMSLKFDMPTFVNCEVIKLTKITLQACCITTGFENLLNTCCSTLQELNLVSSFFPLRGEVSELNALKHLTVDFRNIIRARGATLCIEKSLAKLLKASKNSLEKLRLQCPQYNLDIFIKVFQQVKLPKLKIFQIHPRPDEKEMNDILKQVPDDVALWLVRLNPLNAFTYIPRYQNLMKMLCPHGLFVDVSVTK